MLQLKEKLHGTIVVMVFQNRGQNGGVAVGSPAGNFQHMKPRACNQPETSISGPYYNVDPLGLLIGECPWV